MKPEIENQKEVGGDKLHVNFIFSNKGGGSIFIDDVSIIQLAAVDMENGSPENAGFCKTNTMLYRNRHILDQASQQPNQKVKHSGIKKYLDGTPMQMWDTKNIMDAAIYKASSIYVEGKNMVPNGFTVDSGKITEASVEFYTDPMDWQPRNAAVLCSAISFVGADTRTHWAVCPLWIKVRMFGQSAQPGEVDEDSVSQMPFTLLPRSDNQCRLEESN